MQHTQVEVITKPDTVTVRGALPEVQIQDIRITKHSIILAGQHHGHQFVQELPLKTTVDNDNAVTVFANGYLTIIIPRGDQHAVV